MGPERLWEALRRGGHAMLEVATACACAGITIGVLMLSGLALRLSGILINFSGGNLFVLLILTMGVSLVLGMGLPTSAVYVVLATLIVPAMTQIGVDLMAAHMFVFYFGVLANVTPPVAIAAYTGAGLAGADSTHTGLIAFRLALAGFLLPFMWIYNPALLMQGDIGNILVAAVTGIVGVLSLASAVQGYLLGGFARWYERMFMGVAALALINPGLVTDLVGGGTIALAILSRYFLSSQGRVPQAEGKT